MGPGSSLNPALYTCPCVMTFSRLWVFNTPIAIGTFPLTMLLSYRIPVFNKVLSILSKNFFSLFKITSAILQTLLLGIFVRHYFKSSGSKAWESASSMFVIMNFSPDGEMNPPMKPTPYLSADSFILATSCMAWSLCISMESGMRGRFDSVIGIELSNGSSLPGNARIKT